MTQTNSSPQASKVLPRLIAPRTFTYEPSQAKSMRQHWLARRKQKKLSLDMTAESIHAKDVSDHQNLSSPTCHASMSNIVADKT